MICLLIRYRTGNKNIKAIDKAIDKNQKGAKLRIIYIVIYRNFAPFCFLPLK